MPDDDRADVQDRLTSSEVADGGEQDEPVYMPAVNGLADGWHPVVEDPADSFWANVDC